ncbi:hypothetical protein [Phenylobacterium sp.]|uniref:hypothetical protein n=1 Tax=Phenylobacterium sp. TaxID=1871053 RepID=UPI002732B264|nr:hypothetical protein [Phenylobacterium sp.]MDP3856084.1 hypothetical protein [Phenylobacterium sp.]
MAKRASDTPSAETGGLAGKVSDLAARYAALREEAERAAAAEGLTRARLGAALAEALAATARAEQAARASALAGYRVAARRTIRPRRRNRPARLLDRLLARGGPLGQALVIARSGLWRASGLSFGARLRDLAGMVAYARRGADPQARPAALFDQAWYVAASPDLAAGRMSPLAHYLLRGGAEGRSPHPLIHAGFYGASHGAALAASGLTPLEHFVREGAAMGCDPHPLFSLEHYVVQAPDLIATGQNPLVHYLEQGWLRGLSPHPLFAPDIYANGEGPPLVDYLTRGSAAGRKPHPLFDPTAYRALYPDVDAGGHEPLTHYAMAGGVEGRNPSPWFDAALYMRQRGAARPETCNPLVDYLQGGAWAVGEPWLDRANFEVPGMTPLEHWARQGGR